MPKLTCTSPALHTAETHTRNIYMTRLAREIPTDPAHPIKKNRTYKDKTYTAYKITMNDEQRKRIFTIKKKTVFTVIAE
jgi:hypothetical protein